MTTRLPTMRLVLAAAAAALLAGCTGNLLSARERARPEPVVDRSAADAQAARQYLAELEELQTSTPARQAEVLQGVRGAAESSPTTTNRLRLALMLAIASHPGSDPVAARRQLSELLARPELLLPAERALAAVHLSEVEDRLVLIAENRRLQQEASTRERERATTVNSAISRRLQAELDENARLRKALEEAQRKLEAVTQVERSITERGGTQGKP